MCFVSSFFDFYSNLSANSLFFFWLIMFILILLICLTIVLIIKNNKLIKLIEKQTIKEKTLEENLSFVYNNRNNIIKEDKIEEKSKEVNINAEENKEEEKPNLDIHTNNKLEEEIIREANASLKKDNLFKKNVLNDLSRKQTSPIHILKDEEDSYLDEKIDEIDYLNRVDDFDIAPEYCDGEKSPLEEMDDIYDENDNIKETKNIISKMEDVPENNNVELNDYEKKEEEEAIISYGELQKVKDKIYNNIEDEETDDFIDELRNLKINL